MDTRYNLRSSTREEHVIPVQLQLQSDEEFLTQTLGASHPSPGQVSFNQSDSTSSSDLDVSALLNTSEKICSSPEFGYGKSAIPTIRAHVSGRVRSEVKEQTNPSQADINHQILAQLSRLGDRLTNIEKVQQQTCKKSTDVRKIKNPKGVKKPSVKATVPQEGVALSSNPEPKNVVPGQIPPPAALGQEVRIQQEVQQRLHELSEKIHSGNGKVKSQRGGPVDFFVNHRIKWPHEYILAGQSKDRVTYNQLTPLQWMTGFCRNMCEETNMQIKEHMLDYLINLLEDANDFSWPSAKASHAVLLCSMEQGEVVSWADVDKIDRIRRAHAQRHISQQSAQTKIMKKMENKPLNSWHVYISIKTCVLKQKSMKQRASIIDTFVQLVGKWMAKRTRIHK